MDNPTEDCVIDIDSFDQYSAIFSRGIIVTCPNDPQPSALGPHPTLDVVTPQLVATESTSSLSTNFTIADLRIYTSQPTTSASLPKIALQLIGESSRRPVTPVRIFGQIINVPTPQSRTVTDIMPILEAYHDQMIKHLETNYFRDQDYYIDIDATREAINHALPITLSNYSKLFCICVLLEQIIITTDLRALSKISDLNLISSRKGEYLQPSSAPSIDYNKSMIHPSLTSGKVSINYNLSLKQIKDLICFIHTRDSHARVTAKVNLLSTTKDSVRTDLIQSPISVLTHCFAEYLITPGEILELIFENKRCPVCNTIVLKEYDCIIHNNCSILDWFKEYFPLMIHNNNICIPRYNLVDIPISKHLERLYNLKSQIQRQQLLNKQPGVTTAYRLRDDNTLSSTTLHRIDTSVARMFQPSVSPRSNK